MNVCTHAVNLVCEFFLDQINICLFPTNLICHIFSGMMKLVKFDEAVVCAASQRLEKSLLPLERAVTHPAEVGRGQTPEHVKGFQACVNKKGSLLKWHQPVELSK